MPIESINSAVVESAGREPVQLRADGNKPGTQQAKVKSKASARACRLRKTADEQAPPRRSFLEISLGFREVLRCS